MSKLIRRGCAASAPPILAALALAAGLSSCRVAADQPAAAPASAATPDTVVFKLSSNVLRAGEIQLSNGIVVHASDWQALILASIPRTTASGETVATCTGTLVGPNVALIAAHCVDNPFGVAARGARLDVDNRQVPLTCTIHPAYLERDIQFVSPRGSEDYALCLIDYRGVVPASVKQLRFEVVDAGTAIGAGTPVLMTGYGCSDIRVVDGELQWDPSDHLLRIGDASIGTAASGSGDSPTYMTIRSVNATGPAVCPGDSGGPLFSGASAAQADVARRVIGVNSAVDKERRADGAYDILSFVAAVGNDTFKSWARQWIARNADEQPILCGVNRAAGELPCRD